MPTASEVKVTKLPPGPEREELHYSTYCFDSGLRAKKEIRYGTNPDVLANFAEQDGSIAPRAALASRNGEQWVNFATRERLRRLPEHYRKALEMFYWQGLPHRDVAASLGKSESALWFVVFRAKRRLEEMGRREEALRQRRLEEMGRREEALRQRRLQSLSSTAGSRQTAIHAQ